ncbi:hypothetical protein RE628_14820 [Paenibacillus sp. D2_2]|nr:hypothetical protein [Paenibacillus sp. D2_2]WMT38830.1 hypothetical protein RE628_14820 [Paenibacillus sp. D2_2]
MIQIDILKQLLHHQDTEAITNYFETFRPYDLAECIEQLENREQVELFNKLDPVMSAEILEYLEPVMQYRILSYLDESMTSKILNNMSSDVVVDMMLAIHHYQAEKLLILLPEGYNQKIRTLMTFPEHTAGSLATVDYIAAPNSWTLEKTLQHIRNIGHKAEITSYIYVIGNKGSYLE